LAEDFFRRQAKSLGNGWLKRAERLLDDVPECPEHVALLRLRAVLALESEGDVEKALGLARRTSDLAVRFHDRDMQALALHGICRVHRAELMRLRGSWSDAETACLRAAQELRGFYNIAAGEAFYEIGEIRLRMGDLKRAEEVFHQAHELGREPVPGLALLRLAEGKIDAARGLLDRAVADRPAGSLDRARLLAAAVQVAIAAGDLDAARAAALELEGIATAYGSTALRASAAQARGAVQ